MPAHMALSAGGGGYSPLPGSRTPAGAAALTATARRRPLTAGSASHVTCSVSDTPVLQSAARYTCLHLQLL